MAFMSGLWNSIVGGSDKDIDFKDQVRFYIDNTKKYFSVSEVDHEEYPVVYSDVHKIKFNKASLGFTPINFVTIYYIDTRKGGLSCRITVKSFYNES